MLQQQGHRCHSCQRTASCPTDAGVVGGLLKAYRLRTRLVWQNNTAQAERSGGSLSRGAHRRVQGGRQHHDQGRRQSHQAHLCCHGLGRSCGEPRG